MLRKVTKPFASSAYLFKYLLLIISLATFNASLQARVNLEALQEQVSREQEEDAAAKAAAAEKQRLLDAEAAEQRRQEAATAAERRRRAEEERQQRRAAAERKRKWDEFIDALYVDIGVSWNSGLGSSDEDADEIGQIYYDSSGRYYIEFGYQGDLGLGLRLIGTKNSYFIGEELESGDEPEDTASASGQGYGAHLNLLCCLTIGANQIGLADGLQFTNIDYNPGVITEYVIGIHTDVRNNFLLGFEYIQMNEEEDELRENSSGFSLVWLRYRFGS